MAVAAAPPTSRRFTGVSLCGRAPLGHVLGNLAQGTYRTQRFRHENHGEDPLGFPVSAWELRCKWLDTPAVDWREGPVMTEIVADMGSVEKTIKKSAAPAEVDRAAIRELVV